MASKRVLSVGQCGADHGAISRTLQVNFRAEVVPADTADEALSVLRREKDFALVLVNRVLDGDGADGVRLIDQIKAEETLRGLPVMLVSNYDDYQRRAVAAGAVPGFGKAALGQPHVLGRLREFLAEGAS